MIRHAAAALLIAGHFCAPARANDWIADGCGSSEGGWAAVSSASRILRTVGRREC